MSGASKFKIKLHFSISSHRAVPRHWRSNASAAIFCVLARHFFMVKCLPLFFFGQECLPLRTSSCLRWNLFSRIVGDEQYDLMVDSAVEDILDSGDVWGRGNFFARGLFLWASSGLVWACVWFVPLSMCWWVSSMVFCCLGLVGGCLATIIQCLQNVEGLKMEVSPFRYSFMPYLQIEKIYFVLLIKSVILCVPIECSGEQNVIFLFGI